MARRRADQLLLDRGLAATRTKARALILAGAVLGEGDRRIEKPGQLLTTETPLRLKGNPLPFVSRGGLKLRAALDDFAIDVSDLVCLDVGASTGGFTDCLLQRGARRVFAVDVGYGQIAWSLRRDPRVVVIERTNIRTMAPDALPQSCECIVIDVSFISLKIVVPAALRFATPGAYLVALVKPQFEVGREHVGKGGIVRDETARVAALRNVCATLGELGITGIASMDSPIVGAKGNNEFLVFGRGPRM